MVKRSHGYKKVAKVTAGVGDENKSSINMIMMRHVTNKGNNSWPALACGYAWPCNLIGMCVWSTGHEATTSSLFWLSHPRQAQEMG